MKTTKRLAALVGAALLASAASAQGSNSCGSATPISGTGTFNFNNASATTDGPSTCGSLGRDIWFAWTAPSTDFFTASTCTGTGFDSVIAAYSGTSCPPGAVLACNDDSCGLQSSITFGASSGTTYLIQVGTWNNSAGGSGVLSINTGGGTGGCANPAPGPDVIVGSLNGVGNYGGLSGVGAYSLGTTSCNVGSAELNWFANNNQHPVIGQNMYRYEGGRFEQIGMSWLKHGFAALQQDLCCDCNSSGTSTKLGVGCSDPYGSGLNGSQGGLGPRFEVNAHTGVYAYPFFAQGSSGNTIYKRIQVANSDIDPSQHPGAIFYGEGHYVTPDDAAAGNGNNNASYRRMTVGSFSSGAWSMGLTGNTERELPAIHAWQANDPNVQLEEVQVPNEGLFLVGSNATDNGNGTWHYEYAVFNLNSDVSGGSFTVPVPSSVSVTNILFHDVDHHSGEPYSGTDWPGQRNSDSVSWATDTFASNANANALRWSTLYNFRFDADVPPSTGSATLGLFKPHTPSSVAVDVFLPECGPSAAAEVVRLGTPANPNALLAGQTSAPVIGATWDPVVDHTTFYPSAALDFLAINPDGVAINVSTALGTLLCNVPSPTFIFFGAAGAPFAIGIPDACDLIGRNICSQAGSLGGSGIQLTNALDLVIGNL